MNSAAIDSVARTQEKPAEPLKLLKRIGSTTVEVEINFSNSNNETMADIVRRLIVREVDRVA